MFIGHWAPAFAAAAASPKAPNLAVLFIAAQLVDWAFFAFAILGIEHMRIVPGITVMVPFDLYDMPYTHSLLGGLFWAGGFAALVWLATRNRTGSLIAGLVVLSHWFLDFLVHRPDLTLAGHPPKLGLGLWNHPPIEITLELAITFGALAWYARVTSGPMWRIWVLAALLLAMQAINWFGPPPTEVGMELYLSALAAFALATVAAGCLGRNRRLPSGQV